MDAWQMNRIIAQRRSQIVSHFIFGHVKYDETMTTNESRMWLAWRQTTWRQLHCARKAWASTWERSFLRTIIDNKWERKVRSDIYFFSYARHPPFLRRPLAIECIYMSFAEFRDCASAEKKCWIHSASKTKPGSRSMDNLFAPDYVCALTIPIQPRLPSYAIGHWTIHIQWSRALRIKESFNGGPTHPEFVPPSRRDHLSSVELIYRLVSV